MSTDPNQPENLDTPVEETASAGPQLERGTYEIIKSRLQTHATELRSRLGLLNEERRSVFGSIPTELISTQRITTANNCVAQDIFPLGDQFIFGYNVHLGLKTTTDLADVFGIYKFAEGSMHEQSLDPLSDPQFLKDFAGLYKYYKDTHFQLSLIHI